MLCGVGLIGRQFARPTGLPGRLVGALMARGNASFNRALVRRLLELPELAERPEFAGWPKRVVEIGCGPGVGLAALLERFPRASVLGVDVSPEMVARSRARNAAEVRSGRLTLAEGGPKRIDGPVDLVVAVHVLYFWHQPVDTLSQLRNSLADDGVVALGYRCRVDMPPPARRDFPKEGHLLYDDESDVRALFAAAGYRSARSARIDDEAGKLLGWLTVAGR
jgi:SAM-dependent methyltransferase